MTDKENVELLAEHSRHICDELESVGAIKFEDDKLKGIKAMMAEHKAEIEGRSSIFETRVERSGLKSTISLFIFADGLYRLSSILLYDE